MLKYVVVAVFSICALPCFASAQSGSRMAAPVAAAPMVDAGAQYAPVEMGTPVQMGAPVEMGAPMDAGSYDMGSGYAMGGTSDCGCGQPAPVADCGCGEPVADCGCAPRTRKKLTLTKVSKEVCRLKRVCTTDACGCPKREWVKVKKTVCRNKLTCIDVPARERSGCCLGSRLKGLFSGGCGCRAQADDCGCDAAPVADCGCGEVAAPVADCGCGG